GGQEPPIKTGALQSSGTAQTPAAAVQPVASSAQPQASPSGFEQFWRKSLHDGLVSNTASQPKTLTLKSDWASQASNPRPPSPDSQLELVFRPDPTMHDGRFSNNGWLQE